MKQQYYKVKERTIKMITCY